MARKDDSPPPPPPERSRVRFMFVEVDGTSDDIKTLAQTFAHAVRSPQQTVLPPRPPTPIGLNGAASVTPPSGAVPAAPPASPGLFDGAEPDGVEAEPDSPPPAPVAPSKPTNGTKKKLRTPQMISSLEFKSGAKSLPDYIDELKPKDHSKRYLAITQWLKQYRAIAEVGADHVYTCYRALGLNVPKDVLSVFRAIKSQGWVESGTEDGTFKITHVGENELTKLKGKE